MDTTDENAATSPPSLESVKIITTALRNAARISGVSLRSCERKLQIPTGYLTRILNGDVSLRLATFLDLCDLLGLPPAALLACLFPGPLALEPRTSKLLACLATLAAEVPPADYANTLWNLRESFSLFLDNRIAR